MRLRRRVARLEGTGGLVLGPEARAYAADLAAASGLDPGAVLAKAEAILDRARADGIATAEDLAAWIGRAERRDPAALLAEADAALAAWRAER